MDKNIITTEYKEFLEQLKVRVATSRYQAARSVNKELIILYHHIGSEILTRQEQHAWGTKIIDKLSRDLISAFPEMKGFSTRNLKYMRQFAKEYPEPTFVQEVLAQLTWYHNITLLDKVIDKEIRLFYIKHSITYGWSRNVMVMQIELALHKRQSQAITNFKNKLPSPQSDLAHHTLKDPYIFDFLSIGNEAHEREVEKALVSHIEKFLLELGVGFAFVGRQYKLSIGNEDYYIDLLFYHLHLRAFIIIELKAGKFSPRDVGQLNFYLSAVDEQLKHSTDNPSIGLILCKDKGEQIKAEYALRDMTKPIGLAEYKLTESLPKNIKTALPTIEELEVGLSEYFDYETLERTTAKLQSLPNLLAQERKSLHKLAELYPDLASQFVGKHYDTHATEYQREKTADASSTALEELENIVRICGGYEKLGLTPVQPQLPELGKTRQHSTIIIKKVTK